MKHQPQVEGFTRQETLALTKATPNQLFYLEKAGLVIPTRIGSNKRPTVIFSWEQILEIRTIRELRKETSLQSIRKVVEYLNDNGFTDHLRDKQLIVLDESVFWVTTDWHDLPTNMTKVLRVANKGGKGVGQYMLTVLPPFSEIIDDLWNTAKSSSVIDFESFKARAKVKAA
ncbi:MAG TPA: MerR family transcriptional regulator [Trichocoleus sp.]